ncbi:MAG: hypothetical protein ACRC10_11840 [Thermoguttaceae bacterium]
MLSGAGQIAGFMQNFLSPKKNTTSEGESLQSTHNSVNKDQWTPSPTSRQALELLNFEANGGETGDMDIADIVNLKGRGEMLSQMLQMKLQKFQGDFMQKMQNAGIDTSQPIELNKGGADDLLVANDHQDKAKIEQILAGNEEMTKMFDEIAKLASLSEVYKSVSPEKNGSNNPLAALAGLYAKQSQDVAMNKAIDGQMNLRVNETAASFSFE